jgi:hypothetical protein
MKTHLASVTKIGGVNRNNPCLFRKHYGPNRCTYTRYVTLKHAVHIDTIIFQMESEEKTHGREFHLKELNIF